MQVRSLGQEDPQKEETATHSSILAWEILCPWDIAVGYSPWGHKELDTTEQLHFITYSLWRLSSKGSACQCREHRRCKFDPWVRKIPWSRKWQPFQVFLHGEFHGQRSLAGYSPQGHKDSDMTDHAHTHMSGLS